MPDIGGLCDDLQAEHEALDAIVATLPEKGWDRATPAEGWSVRDQISHLAFYDEQAELSTSDPEGFAKTSLAAIATDPYGFLEQHLVAGREMTPDQVLRWWRDTRASLLRTFREVEPGRRLGWFGPPMSAASFISARLMETWAHGQDVVDAVGVHRDETSRLRHIAHLGVRARRFSYSAHGRPAPEGEAYVELTAPDGETWTWGEPGNDRVAGPALDFCLVVTQRRHLADTDIETVGDGAAEWMSIAQAFAGPPGPGRQPGQFPGS